MLTPGSIPDTVIFKDGISDIRGHLIKSKGAEFKHGLAPVEIVEYRIKIGKEEYEAQFPSGYNIVNRKRVRGRIEVNSSGRKNLLL